MANKLAGSLQVHVRLTPENRKAIEEQIRKAHVIGSERPRTIQSWMEKAVTAFLIINSKALKAELERDKQAATEYAQATQEIPIFRG